MTSPSLAPWPSYSVEEQEIAARVLASGKVNYWTGDEGRNFEQEFAAWCGADHAIAVANGTLALELAMRAAGIGPGDEVVVTPRSFMASASTIINVGAIPVFADICADSQNITPATVAPVLTEKTRAILCVHLAGWPCDMDGFALLAEQHDLLLIEDCAQAHGATYKGRPVGSLGDVAAWSFCQDKIMTTGGEGGMVTANSADIWQAAWSYKDHGKSWDAVYNREYPPGFRWQHESIGSNFRLTEMQSAIGRYQLTKMPQWHEERARNARLLTEILSESPLLRIPSVPDNIDHAFYKFYAFVRPEMLTADWSRDRIMTTLNDRGIPCTVGACPEMYLEKAFEGHPSVPAERLPLARKLGEISLMLPVHPGLGDAAVEHMGQEMLRVCQQALA